MAIAQLTSRNQVNVINKVLRGGLYTVVGSGGVTESSISSGGILGYSVPAGKRAKFKGVITPTAFGSNQKMAINIFDNVAGRIIQIKSMRSTTQIDDSFAFEGVLENSDYDFIINGNNAQNDGSLTCIMEIEELPI